MWSSYMMASKGELEYHETEAEYRCGNGCKSLIFCIALWIHEGKGQTGTGKQGHCQKGADMADNERRDPGCKGTVWPILQRHHHGLVHHP